MLNSFDWTDDQKTAKENIAAFLLDPNETVYSLVGAAGTGKTTLLLDIIRGLRSVDIAAPTHKAKLVAQTVTKVYHAFTVAEWCGLSPDTDVADFDPNKPQFEQKKESKAKDFKVHIFDESSMINQALTERIVQLAYEGKVKVIFVGDACQLPPVKELGVSHALMADNKSELHQIVRQSIDNPLRYILAVLRYMQELYIYGDEEERFRQVYDLIRAFTIKFDYDDLYANRHNLLMYILSISPSHILNGKGYSIINDHNTFYKKATDSISHGGRILCFTNDAVGKSNAIVRKQLGFKAELMVGETLTGYKTLRDGRNNTFLINGMDYTIVKTTPSFSEWDLDVHRVQLRDNITRQATTVNVLQKESYDKYFKLYHDAKSKAIRESKWPPFFVFNDAHALMSFNNAGDMKNDVEYGYAMTIHKSQGSTYKHVFVRVDDVMKYVRPEDDQSILFSLKLLYVAFSRATDVVVLKLK